MFAKPFAALLFGAASMAIAPLSAQADTQRSFQRIATFPTFQVVGDIDAESAPEIVDITPDGMTLVYTDSPQEAIGLVDITDPENPAPIAQIPLAGEPTSVAVRGPWILAAVNTSLDFVNTSGLLQVINLETRAIVRDIPLGGQPDAIDVSPDGRYAAVAIENERDEDLGDGEPPQAPAGGLVIIDLVGGPQKWTTRDVDLVGVADLFPEDPEPEYVDINRSNIAVISFQENNHLALVDLATGELVNDFSAGTVDLDQIDIAEEDVITLQGSLTDVPREPDGVAWITPLVFATADEGDLFGGSRGFTIFNAFGKKAVEAGNTVEHATVRIGHYPEGRSENKGNEPENVEFGYYSRDDRFLFVGSERSSVVLVYQVRGYFRPKLTLKQILPANIGPEGLLAVPKRNLFIAASEEDDRGDKFRGSLNIYRLQPGAPTYPTLVSADRADGTPIPWGAQSALAADPLDPQGVYSVQDSFYLKSRIFDIDLGGTTPTIVADIELKDTSGAIAQIAAETAMFFSDNPALASEIDGLVELVNADGTVNLDPEGIAARADGGFIIASEGAGEIGDDGRAFAPNILAWVDSSGNIERATTLPGRLATTGQRRFGLEGVTTQGNDIYVAFQRAWGNADDPSDRARIGKLDSDGNWTFAHYPLDEPTSPNGGWVGLSEIVAVGDDRFLVIERDNQGGPDARIKKIYAFSTSGVTFVEDGQTLPLLSKDPVRDLIDDLAAPGGSIIEKVEGLTALPDGDLLIVTDNDGVDDSSGETQLIRLSD